MCARLNVSTCTVPLPEAITIQGEKAQTDERISLVNESWHGALNHTHDLPAERDGAGISGALQRKGQEPTSRRHHQ